MATYVFIHGSFIGAWCWRQIVPVLAGSGHRCITFDLPGHGNDPKPPEDVSMQDYVDALVRIIEPLSENPIVVGHSMGGVISASVAERFPDRIRALVYVAALLLPDGGSILGTVGNKFPPEYLAEIVWAPDRRTGRLSAKGAKEFGFPLCPPAIVEEVLPLLTAEPVSPFESRLQISAERFGRVPRYYIECTGDRLVPISLQREMYSAMPCQRVYSIYADHSPFFSAPAELAAALLAIPEQIKG